MTPEERQRKIAELKARAARVPASLALARLRYFMTHCWECDGVVAWGATRCPHCGHVLMDEDE